MMVLLLVMAASGCSGQAAEGPAPSAGDAELSALLAPIRERFDVPALAAAIVTAGAGPTSRSPSATAGTSAPTARR